MKKKAKKLFKNTSEFKAGKKKARKLLKVLKEEIPWLEEAKGQVPVDYKSHEILQQQKMQLAIEENAPEMLEDDFGPVNLNLEEMDDISVATKFLNSLGTQSHPTTTTSEATGVKFDQDKVPLDLIPYEALEEVGKVLKHGMVKYKRANWAGGIDYSRLISAAMRHLNQYNSVEDVDSESGLCHVSHAATNLVFLLWMIKNRPDLDNRWIKNVEKRNVPFK